MPHSCIRCIGIFLENNQEIFKPLQVTVSMEMISIPRTELEKIDFDLVRQFKESLEDVKAGRIRRVA